ncbi:MAG: hypothetical protein M3Q58_12435 [Bacteroidota bacterium]|nr:hypothetical protein [Bacteroidota bacterium]
MSFVYSIEKARKSKIFKVGVVFTLINLLSQICSPTIAFALTAGPSSPEFSSFEPVVTTDIVNEFTGDCTYNIPVLNIPGPDGGDYSLGLSYHSGVSSEEESSWVGLGWTLNPGAINRQKRGYADDFKDVEVKKYNKMKPNWTQLSAFDITLELSSKDEPESDDVGSSKALNKFLNLFNGVIPFGLSNPDNDDNVSIGSISFSKSVRFNNYSGFSIIKGFGLGASGMASLDMSRSGGETTLAYSISPVGMFQNIRKGYFQRISHTANAAFSKNAKKIENSKSKLKEMKNRKALEGLGFFHSSYTSANHNESALPYSVSYNVGRSFNFRGSVEINPYGPIGVQVGIKGNLNTQINIPEVAVSANGFMYNPNYHDYKNLEDLNYFELNTNKIVEADFQIEKESTFSKHDKNLGIPFNNADVFNATGNGVLGGFRLHHQKIGHYYPTFVKNEQKIRQLGVELGIGGTIQVGFDFGFGKQKTTVKDWDRYNYPAGTQQDNFEFNSDFPFMQFFNDNGGEIKYSSNNSYLNATVGGTVFGRNLDLSNFDQGGNFQNNIRNNRRGKSSQIEYAYFNVNGELQNAFGSTLPTNLNLKHQIGQIGITNQEGEKSIYGFPVYSRKEAELTVGIVNAGTNVNRKDDGINKFLAFQELEIDNPLLNKTVVGQSIQTPYANSYLLTQKLSFNYVDVNGNGLPDKDDFGSWTKFNYKKMHGGSNDWYRYRAPYNGMSYNRGRLFDLNDQTASMSSGEKEVCYLEYIETKSHIAFFITNSSIGNDYKTYIETLSDNTLTAAELNQIAILLNGSGVERLDGLSAAAIDPSGKDPAANAAVKGTKKLEKLEKIILFSINDFKQPISTTYFEYNYSLCPGIPNSSSSPTLPSGEKGKLTLKKMWTEGGGITKSKIAPYQFVYDYYKNYPEHILTKYPQINSSATLLENPTYKNEMLDPWGFFRENGEQLCKKMIPWVTQKSSSAMFDPAAWQLKRIILPSGGEIHIQYEQKDYTHVQNRKAMAMVSLQSNGMLNGYKSGSASDGNKYYLNLPDISVTNSSDIINYHAQLHDYFIRKHNKLYFKALYGFTSTPTNFNSASNLDNSDYITGYTTVNEVGLDPDNRIYLSLGELNKNDNPTKDKTLPRNICFEKLHGAAHINLGKQTTKWEPTDDEIIDMAYANNGQDIYANEGDDVLKNISNSNALPNTFTLFGNWVSGKIKNVSKSKSCMSLNAELSFFKLPVFHAKKGGGIRVKRLLSYNPGVTGELTDQGHNQDAMIYGTEYLYENVEGKSSGVALNEPPEAREESPLVDFQERKKQKRLNKLLNGRDTKIYEGPIGESLLPSAQVVHERVVSRNIHQGASSTGYVVNVFHTVKTFPSVIEDHSALEKANDTYRKFNLNLPLGFFNLELHKNWVTQGYVFTLNDMNGKPHTSSTYAGNYSKDKFAEESFSSQTTYEYTTKGEPVTTLVYNGSDFVMEDLNLGTEEDLTMYMSNVEDKTNDFRLELDLNITLALAINGGFGFAYKYSESQLSQHSTSKVIRRKCFLLKTTTIDNNSFEQVTENLAFNSQNGEPVLTRTYGGYIGNTKKIHTSEPTTGLHEGYYNQLVIPASWMYPRMGQKEANVLNSNQLAASAGNVVFYGPAPIPSTINAGFNNVISASATVYKNDWFVSSNPNTSILNENYGIDNLTVALQDKLNSHYYPYKTYVYKSDVGDANASGYKIYNGGLFDNFSIFDYTIALIPSAWYSVSEVLTYSPYGQPLEEIDNLGIYSSVKFGYNNSLPVLVAKNAKNGSVNFIDFEYPLSFVPDGNVKKGDSHSGNNSLNLNMDPSQKILEKINYTSQMASKGISLKLWLKSQLSNDINSPKYGLSNSNPQLKAIINNQVFSFDKIAQTGEWSLYEAKITSLSSVSTNANFDVSLSYSFEPGGESVLIDDVRIQPIDASIASFVYRKDFRVTAKFDDQHFATFYEYNQEGKLIRISIETEKGRKTIQEQQFNTPLVNR